MRIPVINEKKLDKKQNHFSYEPIEELSHRATAGDPVEIPGKPYFDEIQVPAVSVHPSHSAVRDDSNRNKHDPIREAEERAGNLFDYVNWRGDIPMSVDPFNEADNLLLSALVYAPLSGLVPESGSITIYSLNIAFWNKYTVQDFTTKNPALKYAPLLLKKISETGRYRNVRACSFSEELNDVDQCQFTAMTFLLEDGTCYTAFRGTDNTITGWHEDFNLSYMAMTRGQELAVSYLDRVFSGTSQFIRVGGHSKGGNLAVYAGMYCKADVQERIREIYTNDGPGFIRKITGSDEYKRILPKIIKFMPEDSIVGILLDSGTEPIIIKSSMNGVSQHSPYTWMIRRNRMLRAEKRSGMSRFVDRTIDDWIDMLDPDSKKVFIEVLFAAIAASGAKTISEFTEDPMRSYRAFYKSMRDLPPHQRATLLLVLSKLARSGKNQLVSGLSKYLSDLTRKS